MKAMKATLAGIRFIGHLLVASLFPGRAQALSGFGQEVDLGANLSEEDCRPRQVETRDKKPGKQNCGLLCEGWTLSSDGPAKMRADHRQHDFDSFRQAAQAACS
jgi:hypothetical protein